MAAEVVTLSELRDNFGFDEFIDTVKQKYSALSTLDGAIPSTIGEDYCAGIIMQQCILNEMKTAPKQSTPEFQEQLNWFKSEDFLEEFSVPLPARLTLSQSSETLTPWINKVLNTSGIAWRDGIEVKEPPKQCQTVLAHKFKKGLVYGRPWAWKLNDGSDFVPTSLTDAYLTGDAVTPPYDMKARDIQNSAWGEFPCYICGRPLKDSTKDNQTSGATIECEHLLAILCALSNFDIVTKNIEAYTKGEIERLQEEYEWSHKCCNQIKSNVDMVMLLRKNYIYVVNEVGIKGILKKLTTKVALRTGKMTTMVKKLEKAIVDNLKR